MKKYLISTLTAAAAMAVPAFSAELIDSWDFSQTSETQNNVTSITGSQGNLTLVTGGDTGSNIVAASSGLDGYLDIYPSSSAKTYIDVSGASLTTEEGISLVMTIENWSSSGACIFASFDTYDDSGSGSKTAAAIGENGSGNSRSGWFAANGSSGNVDTTVSGSITTGDFNSSLVVTLTFVGNTLSIYEGGALVCQAVMTDDAYGAIAGSINEVIIGSWETTTTSQFSELRLAGLEIYSGDIMAAPEPELFSIFFGLGAVGLVATRRRKRRVA